MPLEHAKDPPFSGDIASDRANSARESQLGAPIPGTTVKAGEPVDFDDHYLSVLNALDREIIPRLVNQNGFPRLDLAKRCTEPTIADEIAWLRSIIVRDDWRDAIARVRHLQQSGWEIDQIIIGVIGGTARALGEAWSEDRLNFVEVSIGAMRLRQLIEHFADHFVADPHAFQHRLGRALLAPVRDEQHRLGADIAARFLRRAGWDVDVVPSVVSPDFTDRARDQDIDLIGFSVGSSKTLHNLADDIAHVRKFYSRRKECPPILLGGALIAEDPSIVQQFDADGFAIDASQALLVAEGFLPSCAPG